MPTCLVISDLHAPWHHPAAFDFLSSLVREYKPTDVVHIGDEIDAHAFSRFVKHEDTPSAKEELRLAKVALQALYKVVPRRKPVRVCKSNHTYRPFKAAAKAGLPSDLLRGIGDILDAPPNWEWSPRWKLDGVLYMHGDNYRKEAACRAAAIDNRCNAVIGHLHSQAGVWHGTGPFDRLFGMSVGCLINPEAPVFEYAENSPMRPVLGAGVVADGVPHFLPLRV